MFPQNTVLDIGDLQSEELEKALDDDILTIVGSGFNIDDADAKEFSDIQKQFQEAVAEMKEKSQTLETVAVQLESIEKEKEVFDEWAKEVKQRLQDGDAVGDSIKVGAGDQIHPTVLTSFIFTHCLR